MKKLSSFFAGALSMLIVMSLAVGASAYTGKVTKELEYRNIKVTLDGVELDLRDVQGNSVEPFMFDGTNYLPVRALSEALGLTVSWDGSTNTVVLQTPKEDRQGAAYKALSEWVADNRQSYVNNTSMYAANSTSGNGSYAVAVRDTGECVLLRQYRKSGVELRLSISLNSDKGTHHFTYEAYMNGTGSAPTVTGNGMITASKLSKTDGFFFLAAGVSQEVMETHRELARVAALDALSFLDDILANQMEAAEYNIEDLGFVRENVVGG